MNTLTKLHNNVTGTSISGNKPCVRLENPDLGFAVEGLYAALYNNALVALPVDQLEKELKLISSKGFAAITLENVRVKGLPNGYAEVFTDNDVVTLRPDDGDTMALLDAIIALNPSDIKTVKDKYSKNIITVVLDTADCSQVVGLDGFGDNHKGGHYFVGENNIEFSVRPFQDKTALTVYWNGGHEGAMHCEETLYCKDITDEDIKAICKYVHLIGTGHWNNNKGLTVRGLAKRKNGIYEMRRTWDGHGHIFYKTDRFDTGLHFQGELDNGRWVIGIGSDKLDFDVSGYWYDSVVDENGKVLRPALLLDCTVEQLRDYFYTACTYGVFDINLTKDIYRMDISAYKDHAYGDNGFDRPPENINNTLYLGAIGSVGIECKDREDMKTLIAETIKEFKKKDFDLEVYCKGKLA